MPKSQGRRGIVNLERASTGPHRPLKAFSSLLHLHTLEKTCLAFRTEQCTYQFRQVSNLQTRTPSVAPSDFLGYDLDSLPPRSSVSLGSRLSYDSLVPHTIPDLPDDVVIKEWEYIASGTHGQIRKILVQHGEVEEILCLKLFSDRWEEEYFREVYAYAFMIHQRVKHCISHVYWKGEFPLSRWGGGQAPPGDGEKEDWDASEASSNQKSSVESIYYIWNCDGIF